SANLRSKMLTRRFGTRRLSDRSNNSHKVTSPLCTWCSLWLFFFGSRRSEPQRTQRARRRELRTKTTDGTTDTARNHLCLSVPARRDLWLIFLVFFESFLVSVLVAAGARQVLSALCVSKFL